MSTIIFGIFCFVVGAAVMFFVYRNNISKFSKVADVIKSGDDANDILKKLKDIIK